MNRIFLLYTGCTPRIAEPELLKSSLAVAGHLGIDLIQKREFACCGGSHIQDIDDFGSLLLNARNLAYADADGFDLITLCNTCQLMLADARDRLLRDEKLREKVNRELQKYNLEFTGRSRVRHFLYLLIDEFGYDGLASFAVCKLNGLKVASFYGCHNIRPRELQKKENRNESPWHPRSMDHLTESLGGTPVYYESAHSCCGFHVSLHEEKTAALLTGEVLRQTYEVGADCIITPCPLCHTNLDSLQPDALTRIGKGPKLPFVGGAPNAFQIKLPVVDEPVSIPVLHFEQLLGIAYGLSPRALGIRHHVVPVKRNARLWNLISGKEDKQK